MIKKRLLCLLTAVVMLFSCCYMLIACVKKGDKEYTVTFDVGSEALAAGVTNPQPQKVKSGGTAVQPTIDAWEGHTFGAWYNGTKQWNFSTDKVTKNVTLTAQWRIAVNADVAKYEEELDWGEPGHLYVHYLRGDHSEDELGITNSASAPNYSSQITSEVYGDWGLWAWEYVPVNGEGRAFYPMKIDVSGAVYDIELSATYNDAGWDSATRNNKSLTITYANTTRIGLQIFSQDSRVSGEGFWVNDGGDVYVRLSEARREKGDYHWFVTQGSVGSGSATFTTTDVNNPYEGLEPGSAISGYDVTSNKGTNDLYQQQPVAEGWENNSVGYQIFIASFADSDGDGMGDLRGIIENLNYLEDLGVDTLWLTPFQSSNSYHGYDIMDYFSVDPRFGTLDDYRELIYEAHKRGMKVLLDFVLNHTSQSNPWFVKSQNLVKETITLPNGTKKEIDYRNFYTWQNEDYVSKITNPVEKAQWYKDPNGYYFYSSFSSSMPELNFDYQATRDAILEVALYWMSFGLDGFRLDAVKHIYMVNENQNHSLNTVQDGGYSFDMDKDVHFFREFNAKLKATYPNALLVGENFNGNPANLAPLYDGMDSQFNFNWYYDTTWNLSELANGRGGAAKILNQYDAAQFSFSMYRNDYIDGIFVSNHDVQRARDKLYLTDVGVPRTAILGDDDWNLSENLAKLYAGMSLTVPGLTWIYNGDELGMFGTKTDNAAGEGAGHEDRWYRQPMKWSLQKEDSAYNCYYQMGFNNYYMGWDALNMQLDGVQEQLDDPNSVLKFYKAVIALRKQYSALSRGTLVSHTELGEVICYSVRDAQHELLIYVNATIDSQEVEYPLPSGAQLLFSNGAGVTGGSVDAMTFSIYLVK